VITEEEARQIFDAIDEVLIRTGKGYNELLYEVVHPYFQRFGTLPHKALRKEIDAAEDLPLGELILLARRSCQ